MSFRIAAFTTAAVLAATAFAAPAQAAVVASLTFTTQTATVFSNEAIQIFLTLHLDGSSDPLTTDSSGFITSGLTTQDIIDQGLDPLDVVRTNLNNSFECSGTFTNGCDPGAYAFDFNFTPPSMVGPQNLNLQPGDDYTFLFGTFAPVGGNAAPGVYRFYNAAVLMQMTANNPAYDPNDPNSEEFIYRDISIANTCAGQDNSCAFTRTVLAAPGAVPEPASWALMISGFGAAGAMLRRRRRVAFP